MNIAFDAKRLFNNVSGLGNYSRTTISLLSSHFKDDKYHLFTPYIDERIRFKSASNVIPHQPSGLWRMGMLSNIWQSTGFSGTLNKERISIFHGLTNELPSGLAETKIKKVVTIHDLIFLRFPDLYNPIDRNVLARNYKSAAMQADTIISVSEYTKQELMHYFQIPSSKIKVIYQTCSEAFSRKLSLEILSTIKDKYNLPDQFILSVGTIEQRKNLLNLVKAVKSGNIKMPIVAIGQPTKYLDEVQNFVNDHKMEKQVIILHQVSGADLPGIYQLASVFVYISIIEGFGIPVLEAMASGIPVITTRGTTMEEGGGDACKYVDPANIEEISETLKEILMDTELAQSMKQLGLDRIKQFAGNKIITQLHNVYNELALQ